jgi:hypothetical protein
MNVYRVGAEPGGGWKVDREGQDRPVARTDTLDAAILYAQEAARSNRPAQIVIQREDGLVESHVEL